MPNRTMDLPYLRGTISKSLRIRNRRSSDLPVGRRRSHRRRNDGFARSMPRRLARYLLVPVPPPAAPVSPPLWPCRHRKPRARRRWLRPNRVSGNSAASFSPPHCPQRSIASAASLPVEHGQSAAGFAATHNAAFSAVFDFLSRVFGSSSQFGGGAPGVGLK